MGTYGKRPRAGRDMSGDTETKEVVKCNAKGNDDTGPQNGRIVNHLVPTAREVEEDRTGSPCSQEGHQGNDGGCPKETFKTDSVEGGNGVFFHYFFFDDELGSGANNGSRRMRTGDDSEKREYTDKS